jgi:anion-transporting  ArsA/GET3 family ATPase
VTSALSALEHRTVVVVCGAGGVGKTTVSASIGVGLARGGARVCVVTVDPARRLADALNLESANDTPSLVGGDWAGELWAVQLHAASTFDALVDRHATSETQAAAIRRSPLYRSLATALGGTQEYMAMERLYELHHEERYDVVVVDTPPTRSALELLDAPERLLRFLSNRVVRSLLTPTRFSLRAASAATSSVLKVISAVVGGDLVEDAVEFFRAFSGMQQGFADRAADVQQLLADPATGFVLVTSPTLDAIEELSWFAGHLTSRGISPSAAIVNRCHPSFLLDASLLGAAESALAAASRPFRAQLQMLVDAEHAARHDSILIEELERSFPELVVDTVPLSAAPARDLTELGRIASALGAAENPRNETYE